MQVKKYFQVYVPVYDRTNTARDNQFDFTRPTTIPRGYVRQLFAERRVYSKTYADNIVNDQNCDLKHLRSLIGRAVT